MSLLNFILRDAADEAPADEPTHPFDNYREQAALRNCGAGAKFQAEAQGVNERAAQVYRNIAAKAAQTPVSGDALAKRFGDNPKTLFRRFFAEQRQLGKSVSQILDQFTDAARLEFATELRELAAEFQEA